MNRYKIRVPTEFDRGTIYYYDFGIVLGQIVEVMTCGRKGTLHIHNNMVMVF